MKRVFISLVAILGLSSPVGAQTTEHLVVTIPVVASVTVLEVDTVTPCLFEVDRRPVGAETIAIQFCETDPDGAIFASGWRSPIYVYGPDGLHTNAHENISTPSCNDEMAATGAVLIRGLNTAALNARSLRQRIMDRLIADCAAFAGTVTGDPQ